MLRKIGNKWALVSKKTLRPLAYYKGEGKPPDSWVADQEARIEYFKETKSLVSKSGGGEEGSDQLVKSYLEDTPGQPLKIKNFKDFTNER